MVRIPNSDAEWEETTHTSGRVFLINRDTNETKWLWQKWEVKGRLFIRKMTDPDKQIWFDEMDLPTRVASGMATEQDTKQYLAAQAIPPPPPPPSSPPPPPPHPHPHPHYPAQYGDRGAADWNHSAIHGQYSPAANNSNYGNAYNQHREPLQPNSYQPPAHYNNGYMQDRDAYAVNPATDKRSPPYYGDGNQRSPTYSHPHPQHQNARAPFPYPNPGEEHNSFPHNRSAHPSFPPPPPLFPSTSHQFGSNRNRTPLHYPQPAPRGGKGHPYKVRKDNNVQKHKKRPHEPGNNVNGRYWGNSPKKWNNRRPYQSSSEHPTPFEPDNIERTPHQPRPAPLPPNTAPLSGELYGPFTPVNKAAQDRLQSCLASESIKIGLLHDRDFKKTLTSIDLRSPNSIAMPAISLDGEDDYSFDIVVGTCENIEKDYLRLTSAPRPEAVRPPYVLAKSFAHVRQCWQDASQDYDWVCRQLKSIRQDYKVQHINDINVVNVYETHARIALENNDLGEFNTCVAQVQELYYKLDSPASARDEFASYRILYNLLVGATQWEQAKMLVTFSVAERNRPSTRFALRIRNAVVTGNYRQYFELCSNPPPRTMISYLLHPLHDRMRFRAISVIATAYGTAVAPHMSASALLNRLGWSMKTPQEAAQHPVLPQQAIPQEEAQVLDTIRSLGVIRELAWVFEALSFLIRCNVVIIADKSNAASGLSRLTVDLKKTKAQGLRRPKKSKKLITCAGSSQVSLLKGHTVSTD